MPQEDDHLAKEASCNVSAHQQGVKRKADTPLGSPLEPGQILEKNEDSSKVKLKIRVRNTGSTCISSVGYSHSYRSFWILGMVFP